MKMNLDFSPYEFIGITSQSPEAETLRRMKVQVNVRTLNQGIYTYKYLINNTVKQTGKIIID